MPMMMVANGLLTTLRVFGLIDQDVIVVVVHHVSLWIYHLGHHSLYCDYRYGTDIGLLALVLVDDMMLT